MTPGRISAVELSAVLTNFKIFLNIVHVMTAVIKNLFLKAKPMKSSLDVMLKIHTRYPLMLH